MDGQVRAKLRTINPSFSEPRKEIIPRMRWYIGRVRLFGHFFHVPFMLLALVEATAFVSTIYFTINLFGVESPGQSLAAWTFPHILLCALILIFSMAAMGLYSTQQREGLTGILYRFTAAFILGMFSIFILNWVFFSIAVELNVFVTEMTLLLFRGF